MWWRWTRQRPCLCAETRGHATDHARARAHADAATWMPDVDGWTRPRNGHAETSRVRAEWEGGARDTVGLSRAYLKTSGSSEVYQPKTAPSGALSAVT